MKKSMEVMEVIKAEVKKWFDYYEDYIKSAPEGYAWEYIELEKTFFEGLLLGAQFGGGTEFCEELEEYLTELEEGEDGKGYHES